MAKRCKETSRMARPSMTSEQLRFMAKTRIRTRKPEEKKVMETKRSPILPAMGGEAFGEHRAKIAGQILSGREEVKRRARERDAKATRMASVAKQRPSMLVGRHTKHSDGTITYHTKSKNRLQTIARIGYSLTHRHATRKARK